ncbi:MAG: hypothetical protein KC451_03370 [Amylibacter sp.]|nr:hypothetical protein [Amylibacter sp.]
MQLKSILCGAITAWSIGLFSVPVYGADTVIDVRKMASETQLIAKNRAKLS